MNAALTYLHTCPSRGNIIRVKTGTIEKDYLRNNASFTFHPLLESCETEKRDGL